MAAARGIERVLAKCEECIGSGNFYEAHQMIRTLYFRYNSQQKYAEAIDLLYRGALTLLNHNQYGSGADLSLLLVDTLEKSSTPVTQETIEKLAQLFEKMDPDCPERPVFVSRAIKWTTNIDQSHTRGHPNLHQKLGVIFWQENNYPAARYHYIHSEDGEGCASMLLAYHTARGYPSEVDLFITQAVLQYLCLKNKTTASSCFKAYTTKHPAIKAGPPYVLPLLNFIWFLLVAVESGKIAVFTILCEKYQISLERDPAYKESTAQECLLGHNTSRRT
ncbi:Golgi to ER traffic protein 4 homolog isoform X2 [Littorina saxatilis]|uniref:Golgi to ER traffic protein 4 homolog isoform X2 n=1 Tax=Littorina saxatilis TaxID=31220 RepID=UPI0038B55528